MAVAHTDRHILCIKLTTHVFHRRSDSKGFTLPYHRIHAHSRTAQVRRALRRWHDTHGNGVFCKPQCATTLGIKTANERVGNAFAGTHEHVPARHSVAIASQGNYTYTLGTAIADTNGQSNFLIGTHTQRNFHICRHTELRHAFAQRVRQLHGRGIESGVPVIA